MSDPFDATDVGCLLGWELAERREAGYDVEGLAEPVAAAVAGGDADHGWQLYGELEDRPRRTDWGYEEPESLAAILADAAPVATDRLPDPGRLADRIWAGWAGRSAGCMLGKPVEGWPEPQLGAYLRLAGAEALDDYIPVLDPMPEGFAVHPSWETTVRGQIDEITRDDDLDYTMLALAILESYGSGFQTADVGAAWLENLPYHAVFTAERATYRNLVNGIWPPQARQHRNPYREWIGAQIRADMWAYVHPGSPRGAAECAYRDATLSHTANGVYGAMWAAATIAACFVAPTMRAALETSRTFIPRRSRLGEVLDAVVELFDRGASWRDARDRIERMTGTYSWVHTINNAGIVAAALLWGEGDFSRTIGLAVRGGCDTDCNGATAGSAFGVMHGRAGLPDRWLTPLHGAVRSAIPGFDRVTLDELARRTIAQVVPPTLPVRDQAPT